MLDWSSCPAVERDPHRVSGAWVFCGTRVPVSALFENLEDGVQITEFVESALAQNARSWCSDRNFGSDFLFMTGISSAPFWSCLEQR